jgi:thiamine-monophosphate kinase
VSEWSRIERIKELLWDRDANIPVGIGDDAAVIAESANVVTVDSQVEHVHFERAWLSMEDLGYRAVMAAASDLVAMRAKPVCCVSSLILPNGLTDAELCSLVSGQRRAADELSCPVVGGNLSRGAELSVTVTVLGGTSKPLLRSGAREGDYVYVAGSLGLAAAGLRCLQASAEEKAEHVRAITAWRRPKARFELLSALEGASAGIDISDGLVQDLGHLARASGVQIVLDDIRFDPEVTAIEACFGLSSNVLTLYGGEDYAIVATCRTPLNGFERIGRCVSGSGIVFNGTRLATDGGHDHFRSPSSVSEDYSSRHSHRSRF